MHILIVEDETKIAEFLAKTGGLGLSIVKSIMMLHDGEAYAYNSQQGIVFGLSLDLNIV
ncbi:hypothetical protein [Acinetobacter schindleri]|nr:hypothetical protein [Acinetobacter schindleri]